MTPSLHLLHLIILMLLTQFQNQLTITQRSPGLKITSLNQSELFRPLIIHHPRTLSPLMSDKLCSTLIGDKPFLKNLMPCFEIEPGPLYRAHKTSTLLIENGCFALNGTWIDLLLATRLNLWPKGSPSVPKWTSKKHLYPLSGHKQSNLFSQLH